MNDITAHYKQILDLSIRGVYAIIQPNNSVFIAYSNNISEGLIRHALKYKDVQIIVLETDIPKAGLKIRASYWIKEYQKLGFNILNIVTNPVSYKVKVRINRDFLVEVTLDNKRNGKLVVGIFDKVETANNFVSKNYTGKELKEPVYSNNYLTKRYLNNKK